MCCYESTSIRSNFDLGPSIAIERVQFRITVLCYAETSNARLQFVIVSTPKLLPLSPSLNNRLQLLMTVTQISKSDFVRQA